MTVQIAENIYIEIYMCSLSRTPTKKYEFFILYDDDDDDAFEEHLSDAQETVREMEEQGGGEDCRARHMDYMCAL